MSVSASDERPDTGSIVMHPLATPPLRRSQDFAIQNRLLWAADCGP